MSFKHFALTLFLLALGALAVFSVLHWLQVPVGNLVDWLIGVGIAWWLLTITTLPWNAYFAALAVVEDTEESGRRGIAVYEGHAAFAHRIASRFRLLAIGLHVVSAAVLFGLAYYRVIAVGYPAAAAALVLTFARPATRAYEHLAERLRQMRHEVRYPRDDVAELRERLHRLDQQVSDLRMALNLDNPQSWAAGLVQQQATATRQLDRLDSSLEELARTNARDHEDLARQTSQAIARLSEDARFLNQVRELIRFVKDA